MFGALDFYQKAKAHGVKPIFGCETYVAPDRLDKTERRSYHLILLAKNDVGYKNLSYLNSMGYLEGFYYNPRIDKQLLREHSRGADRPVGLPRRRGRADADAARARGGRGGGARVRGHLRARATSSSRCSPTASRSRRRSTATCSSCRKKTGIALVATNDCHYVNQSDARAHEILMCVQQKKTINDEKRLHHRTTPTT